MGLLGSLYTGPLCSSNAGVINALPLAPCPPSASCPPSGQAAALAGGTTLHIDFALPVDHDLLAGWEAWRKKAEVRQRCSGAVRWGRAACGGLGWLAEGTACTMHAPIHPPLFPHTHPPTQAAVMDYSFHMAVTSWSPRVAADMGALVARGVNSFKFFMAYKGGWWWLVAGWWLVALEGCVPAGWAGAWKHGAGSYAAAELERTTPAPTPPARRADGRR